MTQDNNQKTYTSPGIVKYYAQLSALQPAEAAILELLQERLGTMKMLDIGVGGGRTTAHFSELAAEYIGIDYSADMIAACQKRFSTSSKTVTFQVCDARDMSRFKDNSFDFILFSFNGIDYISHADRLLVFQEIQRIGKSGGYFYFSSHNLKGFEQGLEFRNQFSLNPLQTYVNLVMSALLHLFNLSTTLQQIRTASHSILKDESHNFRLKTYYVRPQEQIHQLKSRFCDIQVYSWKNGLELTGDELDLNADMWLYYLCVVKEKSVSYLSVVMS